MHVHVFSAVSRGNPVPVWPTGWCQIDCEWSYLGDKRYADIKGSNRRPPSGPREREVAGRQYTILTPVSVMEPPTLPPSGSPSSQEDAIADDPSHESDVATSEVELRRPLGGALPVSEAGVEVVSQSQSQPPPQRYSIVKILMEHVVDSHGYGIQTVQNKND